MVCRLSSALQQKSREKVGIKIGKRGEKVGIIGEKGLYQVQN